MATSSNYQVAPVLHKEIQLMSNVSGENGTDQLVVIDEERGKQKMGMDRRTTTTHDEDNTNQLEALKKVIEKQEDRVNDLRTTAFQLANYYFVSQAVVFTALASGSSSLVCHDVWFPLVLSLVPAFLNFFALVVIGNHYRKAINLREFNSCTYETLVKKMNANCSRGEGSEQQQDSDPKQKTWHAICFYACMIAFAFFAFVVAMGSFWILCGEKKIVKNHDGDPTCVNLLCDGDKCVSICAKY